MSSFFTIQTCLELILISFLVSRILNTMQYESTFEFLSQCACNGCSLASASRLQLYHRTPPFGCRRTIPADGSPSGTKSTAFRLYTGLGAREGSGRFATLGDNPNWAWRVHTAWSRSRHEDCRTGALIKVLMRHRCP